MTHELSLLRNSLEALHKLEDSEWQEFSLLFTPFTAGRKEILTTTGEVEKYLYFVTQGVQRVYFFDEQEHEATIVFTYAPSFGGVIDSMTLGTPSKYFYETLTSSTFLRARFADVLALMQGSHSLRKAIDKGLMLAFSGVMLRLVELQSFSSEEKFRTLMRRSPHILQVVPHKYIANYLGIDPTNFSKLINSVKI